MSLALTDEEAEAISSFPIKNMMQPTISVCMD
jgi:hypothetical protein